MSTPFDLQANTAGLFATPLVTHTWPDSDQLNTALRAAILERAGNQASQSRSSVGGWQSSRDLFTWPLPEVATLQERILQITTPLTKSVTHPSQHNRRFDWQLEGWANICRRSHYHRLHNHPNCLWSGVYYVATGTPDAGDPANHGQLELLDPRPAAGMVTTGAATTAQRCLLTPKPGLMVVFPSWLQHQVHPCAIDGERISISYNFMVAEVREG